MQQRPPVATQMATETMHSHQSESKLQKQATTKKAGMHQRTVKESIEVAHSTTTLIRIVEEPTSQ